MILVVATTTAVVTMLLLAMMLFGCGAGSECYGLSYYCPTGYDPDVDCGVGGAYVWSTG